MSFVQKNHRSLAFTVDSGAIWICAGWGWGSATQKFWILVDYLMTGCFLLPGEGRCVVMWSPSCPEVSLSCRLLSMGEEKLPLVTGSLMLIDVEECLTMDCASTTTGDMWAGSPMTLMRLSAKTDIFLQAAPGTPPVSQEAGTLWMSMGNFENLHSLEDSEVITTMQDQIMLGISLLLSKYAAPN